MAAAAAAVAAVPAENSWLFGGNPRSLVAAHDVMDELPIGAEQDMLGSDAGQGMDMEKMMQMMAEQGMGGMPPMGGFKGVQEDVKYILCDTCRAMVDHASSFAEQSRQKHKKAKVSESDLDDALEKMCDTKSAEGSWINKYDMVEAGDRIELLKKDIPGKCQEECKTIEMACQKVQDEIHSDLVEKVYLNKLSKSQLTELACSKWIKSMEGSCAKEIPKVPRDRAPQGDNFVPMTGHDLEMEEINRKVREGQERMEL